MSRRKCSSEALAASQRLELAHESVTAHFGTNVRPPRVPFQALTPEEIMSIHSLSPKMLINFPHFLPKFSPFWRPQVGIESVSEMANIFPNFFELFYTIIFPVSDTLFIPVSDFLSTRMRGRSQYLHGCWRGHVEMLQFFPPFV